MRQFAFVDWNLVTSTPVERAYCRGLRPHAALRISISLVVLLIVVVLGLLLRDLLQGQPASSPAQATPLPATRSDETSDAQDEANPASTAEVPAQGNVDRTGNAPGALVGVVYWSAVGLLGALGVAFPISPLWRRISIEWDGTHHLTVTSHGLWPSRHSWSLEEIGGIAFGIREQVDHPANGPPVDHGWFWFIHLLGRQLAGTSRGRILVELLVAHQDETPATDTGRAVVPHKVKDLVQWLEECTHHRARSPVLLADKKS